MRRVSTTDLPQLVHDHQSHCGEGETAAVMRLLVPAAITSCYTAQAVVTPAFASSQVEASFNARRVDVAISAHMHGYQRSWPLALGGNVTSRSYANPTAPVYVVNGAAGNREGNERPAPANWSAFESGDFGGRARGGGGGGEWVRAHDRRLPAVSVSCA